MSSYTSISSDKLARLVGTANAPLLVDVRIDEDFAGDPATARTDLARARMGQLASAEILIGGRRELAETGSRC